MSEVGLAKLSAAVDADVEKVWAAVRSFGNVERWHPAVIATRMLEGQATNPGAVREITLRNGGTVAERLLFLDDDSRKMGYEMVSLPIPVSTQRNEIFVECTSDCSSRVTFSAVFRPAEGHTEAEIRDLNLVMFGLASEGLKQFCEDTGGTNDQQGSASE